MWCPQPPRVPCQDRSSLEGEGDPLLKVPRVPWLTLNHGGSLHYAGA